MNVVILTSGTLGDGQPYVALGAGLKAAGHEVTLVTGRPPVYIGFGSAAPDPEGSRSAVLAALRGLGLRATRIRTRTTRTCGSGRY